MLEIIGIRISGTNYFYTQGEFEDGILLTETEMLYALRRQNRLNNHINNNVTDEDEWDATENFIDENGVVY